MSILGNLAIQLSDHLFQFVILEGFYKDLTPKKTNIFEINFRNFSEQELHNEKHKMEIHPDYINKLLDIYALTKSS